MFVLEFFEDTPISYLVIVDRIIRFILPKDQAENFATRYSLKASPFGNDLMAVEVLSPVPITKEYLQKFINDNIQDEDLTQELKQGIAFEYEDFNKTLTIEYLAHLIEDWICFFDYRLISLQKDLLINAMPLYMEFIDLRNSFDLEGNLPTLIRVGNKEINSREITKLWISLSKQIHSILYPLLYSLKYYDEQDPEELQELFENAFKMPLPDFKSFSPELYHELETNLKIAELKTLYFSLAKGLTQLKVAPALETAVAQFAINKESKKINPADESFEQEIPNYKEYEVIEDLNLQDLKSITQALENRNIRKDILEKANLTPQKLYNFTPQKQPRVNNFEPINSPMSPKLKRLTPVKSEKKPSRITTPKTEVKTNPTDNKKPVRKNFLKSENGVKQNPIPNSSQTRYPQQFTVQKPPKRSPINREKITPIRLNFTQAIEDDYSKAIRILQGCEKSKGVIKAMERLKAVENSWNPYWIDSDYKLQAIISAVLKLNLGRKVDLEALIKNEESDLYQALNMQRLFPLTFLGQLGLNHAKSTMLAEEEVSPEPDEEIECDCW